MNNELTAALLTIDKYRELSDCPAGVDLQDWVKQLAAENAGLKEDRDTLARYWIEDGGDKDCAMSYCEPTPATDRIVAGIKAEEEKTVLNDLLRHLDKIDIGSLSSPGELSSEVVAFVNSRLLREGADK